MPKPKNTDKKKVSRKLMGQKRGGSSRNVSGVAVFADYAAPQSDALLSISWIISGSLPTDFTVYLYASTNGAPFHRSDNNIANLAEINDEPSDNFDATFAWVPDDTVQSYAVCLDSRGELLARSPIVTTVFA